ncbi:MFS transporter [Streptomyces sp. TP-A0874]|uniref:MFS transporter n=1 Tax=Streptomyces sp. TP-A0874 TaxID=549819 RepID=UPI00085296A8|nr:MFS transporter [Streptomyces sp. TP-A0874]
MTVVGDLWRLLQLPDFRRLLAIRLLSQSADGVFQVALAAYVVFSPEKEASPAAVASAMAVLLLPYSLIGPFAGVLLDRWRRRQVLLHGNLIRTALTAGTALLVVAGAPDALFYLAALSVTAVNRFVLAGLSAALPRVVDEERRLVTANALTPTAGTLAATFGGGAALVVRLTVSDSAAVMVLPAAALYLAAALAALRIRPQLLGPASPLDGRQLLAALAGTVRGLTDGVRHLAERRRAGYALLAMTVMRFCYGALTVMLLMLCRYAWTGEEGGSGSEADGLAMLGLAVGLSGAGFFTAAVLSPSGVGALGAYGWIAACAAGAAVLEPSLGLFFAPAPALAAAFVLGLATQGAKIATDTVVQSSVDDAFRGRAFTLYDMLFNVSFVAASAVAALVLPPDGRSVPLVVGVALLYGAVASAMAWSRRRL